MKTIIKEIPVKCPACDGKGCAACNNGVIITKETIYEAPWGSYKCDLRFMPVPPIKSKWSDYPNSFYWNWNAL